MASATAQMRDVVDGVVAASGWSMTPVEAATTLVELARLKAQVIELEARVAAHADDWPPWMCPGHHWKRWSDDGDTNLDNGCLTCPATTPAPTTPYVMTKRQGHLPPAVVGWTPWKASGLDG